MKVGDGFYFKNSKIKFSYRRKECQTRHNFLAFIKRYWAPNIKVVRFSIDFQSEPKTCFFDAKNGDWLLENVL
jgi:hypothetical protein